MVWSDEKTIALIELVGTNYYVLFPVKRSDATTKTACDQTWANLTDILNARFLLEQHNETKVRNKWKNLKQAAMQYDASRKEFATIPGGSLFPRNSLFDLVLQANKGVGAQLLPPPSEHQSVEGVKIEESTTTMDDVLLGMAGVAGTASSTAEISLLIDGILPSSRAGRAEKRPLQNSDVFADPWPAEKQPRSISSASPMQNGPTEGIPTEELQRRLLEKQLENAGKISNLLDSASEFLATGSDLMRSFMASGREMNGTHPATSMRSSMNGP